MNLFKMQKFKFVLLFSILICALNLGAQVQIPQYPQEIIDQPGLLSEQDESRLVEIIKQMNLSDKVSMSVFISQPLGDYAIESAALEIAEKWKLGNKNTDQGLLLLISPEDRKLRFEVGYGLEGYIPDLKAFKIIEGMKPYLGSGDYAQSIEFALFHVIKALEIDMAQEYLPRKPPIDIPWIWIIVIMIFLFHFYLSSKGLIVPAGGGNNDPFDYHAGGRGHSKGGGGFSGGFGGGGFGGGGASGSW